MRSSTCSRASAHARRPARRAISDWSSERSAAPRAATRSRAPPPRRGRAPPRARCPRRRRAPASRASEVSPTPRRGRFAIRVERDGVVRVVDRLEVGDRVLDLGALVEPRPADHLVVDPLPDEHVLEHAALRVRAVDDRDLAPGSKPSSTSAGDLGGDEPRLGVLVLDLDHPHRLALAELRPEPLLLALAVVRDHRVRGVRGSRSSSGSSARAGSRACPGSRFSNSRMLRMSAPRNA